MFDYDISNLIKGIGKCSCGKIHKAHLDKSIIKNNAIEDLPSCVKQYNGSKAFIIADKNTFAVAGEKVEKALSLANISYSTFIFSAERIEPDEHNVGSVLLHFDKSCDIIIGIGSGVINDIGKIIANVTSLTYIIVATAPSMDGYASSTSSVIRDGLKVSIDSKCPNVVIGDLDILRNAPMEMILAGLGDILAKYISVCEWRIGHIVTDEYYCEEISKIIRYALKKCVDNAFGIVERDTKAVESVMEAMVISGIAADFAGVSRPVSGIEHYFSHLWDMRSQEFGTPASLHGIQCGIGTLLAIKGYDKVKEIVPDKDKALKFVTEFNDEEWFKVLDKYLRNAGTTMIKDARKSIRYNRTEHLKRLDKIIDNWDEIQSIIKTEIPNYNYLYDLLKKIGAPTTSDEIGIPLEENAVAFKATKDIRDKYILSTLLWDVGFIDEVAEIY